VLGILCLAAGMGLYSLLPLSVLLFQLKHHFLFAHIAKALVDAHKRGGKGGGHSGQEPGSEKYTSAAFLANSRIPTFIDARHAIAHKKIMIIDRETVITGSFNFTKAAEEKNAGNLLIIKSKELAGIYIENWKKHLEHSERYEARY
jgi:phosphatidylserine/phosphatidylglycerophosphate/cardiolipin synthase-like enzyme